MKKKDEIKFSNTSGGAAMMPVEESPSDISQTDDLRAYVPAGAAMAPVAPQDEEDYYEDENCEESYEDDDSATSKIASDMGQESASELISRFSEQDRMEQELKVADLENETTIETSEDEANQEGPTDHNGANSSGTEWSTQDIVRAINDIARRTVETGKLEIGQFVFEKVFKGEITEVLSKNPNKSASLRAICDDEDLMVDHRKLGSWVKAAALRSELEGTGVDVSKFYLSHFLAILRVGIAEKRLELAKRAVTEGLSGRDIVSAIEAAKQKSSPPTKGEMLLKKVDDPFSLFADENDKEFLSNKARLEMELDSEERLRIVKAIDRRLGKMTQVNEFLKTSKKNLLAIEMENLNGDDQ